MKICIIIATVNELANISAFNKGTKFAQQHKVKIKIVDEGDVALRKVNRGLLAGMRYDFYGPKERMNWFKARFGLRYKDYLQAIPERCHAETSFGFLVAFEEKPDVVIELDDDVYPMRGYDLIESHANNLLNDNGVSVYSRSKWYNTIENFAIQHNPRLYPRGHPYSSDARSMNYVWSTEGKKCVLNMGLWSGHLDLDALTILHKNGLSGKCKAIRTDIKRSKIVVGPATYFALCSMNTAFLPKIIPAFYQLYMKHMGVDRFDDIWSGIILKKIADHLGDAICLGQPMVYHEKKPRNAFEDLRVELEGMAINEVLWRIVDGLDLNGETYFDAYRSLIMNLERRLNRFHDKSHRKFMSFQIKKMKLWLEIIDKLE